MSYDLAETCVFSKQSLGPLRCDLRQLHMRDVSPIEALFIPKLQSNFAEFLNESSLERLRILSSSTCVGLRYGHPINSLRGFSSQVRWPVCTLAGSLSLLRVNNAPDLPRTSPYKLGPALPSAGWP